jgi:hypothetical protein
MNQYLASRGYEVLSVNYRLGIMYGRDFRLPPSMRLPGLRLSTGPHRFRRRST